MKKQVDKSHYLFEKYMSLERWISLWHQLNEVIKLKPKKVLEIGPGPGFFQVNNTILGINVVTLDLDPELSPDYVESVFDMSFENEEFDVVCAFQMLEHLPFEQSLIAFSEMVRVSKRHVIISLPDASKRWPISIKIPFFNVLKFSIPFPSFFLKEHEFDGEHYWEVNKKGFKLNYLIERLLAVADLSLLKLSEYTSISTIGFLFLKKNKAFIDFVNVLLEAPYRKVELRRYLLLLIC